MKYAIWLLIIICMSCGENRVGSKVTSQQTNLTQTNAVNELITLKDMTYKFKHQEISKSDFETLNHSYVFKQLTTNEIVDLFDVENLVVKFDFYEKETEEYEFKEIKMQLRTIKGKILGESKFVSSNEEVVFKIMKRKDAFEVLSSGVELVIGEENFKANPITNTKCFYGKVVLQVDESFVDKSICEGTTLIFKGEVSEYRPKFVDEVIYGEAVKIKPIDLKPVIKPILRKNLHVLPTFTAREKIKAVTRHYKERVYESVSIHDSELGGVNLGENSELRITKDPEIKVATVKSSNGLFMYAQDKKELMVTGIIEVLRASGELYDIGVLSRTDMLQLGEVYYQNNRDLVEEREYQYNSKLKIEYIAVRPFSFNN